MSKQMTTTVAIGLLPTLGWWFVEMDMAAPFDDIPSRLLWLFLTALFAVGTYSYPGWNW